MNKLFLHLILFFFFSISISAQVFVKKKSGESVSFKKMQIDFNDWKKNNDISQIKHWKYFKRWEMETQLHTNAKGEPDGQKDYIDAAVSVAQQKEFSTMNKMNTGIWYPVGPNILPANLTNYMTNGLGRINCIAFHPTNPNTYFVGVAQGGLWQTTDNGLTWIPLTDNLPITRISDISIDPSNPQTMYISVCDFEYIGIGLFMGRKRNTHYGLGVYKTIDGGATWSATGLTFQLTQGDASLIRKVLVDPNNSNKLVACGVNGMYTSANGGTTWTHTLDSLFWDLTQDPISPNILYAATGWVQNSNIGSAAIYKSVNFGTTWSIMNTGIPLQGTVQRVKLAIAPSNNNYIYALTVDTQSGLNAIYKSTNAGLSWTSFYNGNIATGGTNLLEWNNGTNNGGQGNYDCGFMVNPNNQDVVYVGGINIWMSTDGATTFEPVMHWTTNYGPSIHGDIHFIAYQPLTNNLFVCSDGGIYRTSAMSSISWAAANAGTLWPTVWTSITSGMQISSCYRISSSKSLSGEIITGAQDNSSLYYNGASWSTIMGGDGMDNYIDTASPGTLIGSSQYGGFYSTTDGGVNNNGIFINTTGENGEWTTPLIADYNNPGTLYVGHCNVRKSTDNGNSWSQISNFNFDPLYANEISALAVANTDENTIYAARRVRYEYGISGSLWMTSDGGANWIDVTSGIPDSLYYTSVEISRTDNNTVYISMAGFSTGNKIFKTVDGGNTWTNISFNIPNIPVNCIKSIPETNDLMIATDLGIWKLTGGSNIWTNESAGLPNVITTDIEFNSAKNKIYISTFGRGVWATDLDIYNSTEFNTNKNLGINLFPTVNNGSFTISGYGKNNLELEIYDVNGKVVSSQFINIENSTSLKFNLPSGIYFARFKNESLFEVKKFIIEK